MWRNRKFRTLLHEWNLKLEQSGFIDAEIELKGDRALKQRATNAYRQATDLERESRLEYYRTLGHLVNNTLFPTDLEKTVMFMHSDGASVKEIVEEIFNKRLSKHKNRWRIRHIIRRWEMRWGIKYWNLRQMNLKKSTG